MSNNSVGLRERLKFIGPGLLFASNAIGTSHLILSTRAGAHYGMVFFWIILATLVFKYPFFEFGVRFTNGTGKNLLRGYKELGNWAVILFLIVIFIGMFAVTGALGAVCGGLLQSPPAHSARQADASLSFGMSTCGWNEPASFSRRQSLIAPQFGPLFALGSPT
jgi:hypothetical protein